MNTVDQEREIKLGYSKYIYEITVRSLTIKLVIGILILLYFVYSDLGIRHNFQAFYTRLLPISIGVSLMVFHLLTPNRFFYSKTKIFNLFLVALVVMMYGKCFIHLNLHDNTLASSVSGTILILFIVSLDIKTNTRNTIIIYLAPLIIFLILLFSFSQISKEEFLTLTNIFPIVIVGFVLNRIQNQLRFNSFKSGYLLEKEKVKTDRLYSEMVELNSELKRKNEEINFQNQQLEEANATKNKFISIIAHDLRNPFVGMLGFSDFLMENFDEFKLHELKENVGHLNISIKGTNKLLENLLAWTMCQHESIKINPSQEDLFLLIEDIIHMFKSTVKNKSIFIQNNTEHLIINTDKDILNTIVRNLISNAVKYTPTGGRVIISGHLNKNNAEISVKDTGVGIPEKQIPFLFNVSRKYFTKGTANEVGTGLGLILCKEFTNILGGTISATSEVGKGSEFVITFPVKMD